MLLYDRVLEYCHWALRTDWASGNERFVAFTQLLRRAVCYELSAVIPLFQDWKREADRSVCRRPPADCVWAEWKQERYYEAAKGMVRGTEGCLLVKHDLAVEFDGQAPPQELFIAYPFGRADGYDDQELEQQRAQSPLQFIPMTHVIVIGLWDDGCQIGLSHHQDFNLPKDWFDHLASDLPVQDSFSSTWPAFMAFALLHCRNIVTEDHVPDPKLQRRVQKSGNPPRVTYKTLKIEVPRSVHDRQHGDALGEEDAGPKVRFHLCSGHFRELRSERFKNKRGQWVWVPAHYRGSKDLGEVHKTYHVTPQT